MYRSDTYDTYVNKLYCLCNVLASYPFFDRTLVYSYHTRTGTQYDNYFIQVNIKPKALFQLHRHGGP